MRNIRSGGDGGSLSEHNRQILARLGDTRPVQPMMRLILVNGKKEHLLAGTDAAGKKYAPLKKSTLKRRNGNGPPLVPARQSSRPISRYFIKFENAKDGVRVFAGWNGIPWINFHRTGTARMARRDPGGFRERDRQAVGAILRNWIMNGTR